MLEVGGLRVQRMTRGSSGLYVLLLVPLLTQCVSPSWGVVRRFEGQRFRACRMNVGWWAQDLVDHCGEPTWVRRRVGPDGLGEMICAGYSSAAIAGAVGEVAAPQVVACLGRSFAPKRGPALASTTDWLVEPDQAKALVVREVFLVSEGPPSTP